MEAGGRLTLGHVPGPVDAYEGERHAAQAGPLQSAEPVADGLVAEAVAVGEALDVIAHLFGSRVEGPVREDERGGEVVGNADAGEGVGGGALGKFGGGLAVQFLVVLEQGGVAMRNARCPGRCRLDR